MRIRICPRGVLLLALLLLGSPRANPQEAPASGVERLAGGDAYAIVVSRATWKQKAWREVVQALRAKRSATVLIHSGEITSARAELARVHPRYACFVARPAEAGRSFVIAVHRLTRKLDSDPYTDVLWGILTGYEAADALRIVRTEGPLVVRRVAAGCGLDLEAFREGVFYSESQRGVLWRKKPGEKARKLTCPPDTTAALVATLNTEHPDFFLTSGHATFRDWQIGYSYRNGQFRCRDGQLFGLDTAGRRYPIHSPNPKIYSGAGNCLIGLVADRQTMALAWMHSGGARQFLGYVVSTWFGYGGHGVNQIFIEQQGRFTFAEAFFLNQQALLNQLQRRYPGCAAVNFERWDIERDHSLLSKLARAHKVPSREALGLLWDRDTVAFYGDPAWKARLERVREPAWDQSLEEVEPGRFRFALRAHREVTFSRPPMAFLPHRIGPAKILRGAELQPLICDDFLLLTGPKKASPSQEIEVVFSASRAGS